MGVPPLACPTRAPADAAEGVDALSPLRSGSWFRGLPADMRAALLEAGTIRRLEPGEVLFQRGDPFDGLYAVIAGAVLVHAHDAGGKAALLGLLEAGAWFGEICLFDGLLRTHDARAATRAAVWHVPRARLDAMLAAQPS